MKLSQGVTEKGVVVGNTFDKYNSKNPIVQKLMQGFESSLCDMVKLANPSSIHEVGCGEGYWVLQWLDQGINARGSDFSSIVIEMAKENAGLRNLSEQVFAARSIYDLQDEQDSADLIVCCEVMEHLEQPEEALRILQNISRRHVLLSVPREPVWSLLNMARGKYWGDLGNTPGHIQRWSKRDFTDLVSQYFKIEQVRSPMPWTMLLCTVS